MGTSPHRSFPRAVAALALAGVALPAAAADGRSGFEGGFHLGVLYSSLSAPTFRLPGGIDGGPQVSVPQDRAMPSLAVGYDYGGGSFGAGARLTWFRSGFGGFATPEMPGSSSIIQYSSPTVTLVVGDILLHWAPAGTSFFSLYGLLGLGASVKSYTISGSTMPGWDGKKSLTEFEYCYGLGARLKPWRFLSAFVDFRLFPGDTTMVGKDFLYSKDGWNYYRYGDSYTEHYTSVISGGAAYHF